MTEEPLKHTPGFFLASLFVLPAVFLVRALMVYWAAVLLLEPATGHHFRFGVAVGLVGVYLALTFTTGAAKPDDGPKTGAMMVQRFNKFAAMSAVTMVVIWLLSVILTGLGVYA